MKRILMPRIIALSLLLLLLNFPIAGVVADDLPPVLDFSTYAGGSGFVEGEAVAVDAQGNIYLTGSTTSSTFPASNPFNLNLPNNTELIYVMKFDPSATTVLYSVFLGVGIGYGIEVDANGYAYVTGEARGVIPIKNAIQSNLQGSNDAFVTRLYPSGQAIAFSTYLGGSGIDLAEGISLDASNNIYISGATGSTDFPTHNAVQPTLGGAPVDAFITKLNATGSLVYSTFYGGSKDDVSYDITVDPAGNAYITGYTLSEDWPTLNPYQAVHANPCDDFCRDGFVSKFSPSGTPIYSSYLGGDSDWDIGVEVAVDKAGSLYVTGTTSSGDFPTVNAYQASASGTMSAAFVTKFSPDGSELIYSTYLSGNSADAIAFSLVVDANGNAYVGGNTSAPDFPTMNPIQATHGGTQSPFPNDAFLTQFSADGQTLLFSTYLGGSGDDAYGGFDLAYNPNGSVILGGATSSTDFPLRFPYQSTGGGGGFPPVRTAFLAKISFPPIVSQETVPPIYFFQTDTPTLTWTPITYTTQYHIQVSRDEFFTYPLEFETIVEVSDLAFPHYPRVVINAVMNGQHYWRVQAKRPNGSWTDWSPVASFTVRSSS
jgi:hypothetical protein